MTTSTGGIVPDWPPVSAIGLGCWAIGGPFLLDGRPDGWGEVDDAESIRAVQAAVDQGVTLFDTADAYGAGHSERVLGQALRWRRSEVLVATKFGYTYHESRREVAGTDVTPGYVRRACDASLRRLRTDHIDLYQLHVADVDPAVAEDVFAVLENLVDAGKIRGYGWSTDDPVRIRLLRGRRHARVAQFDLNVLSGSDEARTASEDAGLLGLARTPLAMGLLTGKFDSDSRLPTDDVRGGAQPWVRYFTSGRPDPQYLRRLAAVREILTSDGRTLAQGALAWIMARGQRTVPIPGFKSVSQAVENAHAAKRGPLDPDQMARIDALLGR
jgi:aryl-alcohol dehydrogenase-like predicted oxidoreductase